MNIQAKLDLVNQQSKVDTIYWFF